ncbi:MAG: PAS domain S-box protein, partial [Euryarchaeota archaeon]|nr:PAS domain S-box protein [Euryarchaeota archaeon]
REHKGVSSKFVRDFSELGNDHGIIRQAADFKAAVVGDEGEAETRHAWASVPLLYRDETYGVMVLVSKRPAALGEEERRTLTILGSQAGGAIYNALLYDATEQMKRYLEGLIRDSADPIVTYDLEGRARGWNEAASKLYAFGPEEVLGKVLVEVPEDRREETLALFERVGRGGTIADLETVRRRKDGSFVHVAVTYSPIADSAGTVIGISSISRDLTLKRSIEEERIRTKVLEARGRIREVLVDVVPLILRRRIPEQDRNEFVSVLSLRLEEALYDDYLGDDAPIDAVTLGESISKVFNDMGGSFVAEASGDEIAVTGTRCPWGNETKRNPVTCMLTKSISSRFAKRALGGVKVDLTRTLANRDDRCEIVIRRMKEIPD